MTLHNQNGNGRLGNVSRDSIAELSRRNGEPDWLREQRLAAWDAYARLPVPAWTRGIGQWWRTELRGLTLEDLPYYTPAPQDGGSVLDLPALTVQDEHAGLLVQRNSEIVHSELGAEAAGRGLIFADLATAAREHGEIVRKHLFQHVSFEENKIVALNAALWSGGVFIYVPRGVTVDLPLHGLYWIDQPGGAVLAHTLIVAEPGSTVRYVEECRSANGDGLSPVSAKPEGSLTLNSSVVEVSLAQDSKVEFFNMENWGADVLTVVEREANVGRNARMHWVFGVLGGRINRSHVVTRLAQPGAETQTRGIYFAGTHQHFDLTSLTHHQAANCTGDILFKGALRDVSHGGFEGMIRVEAGAQQTNSYLSDHLLFLSDKAKGDSVPGLEILANDVRCSHGATIGMIDPEQVFYGMSRGLTRVEAEKLIVGGFFEQVLQEMPHESMREQIREQIQQKVALPASTEAEATEATSGRAGSGTRLAARGIDRD